MISYLTFREATIESLGVHLLRHPLPVQPILSHICRGEGGSYDDVKPHPGT